MRSTVQEVLMPWLDHIKTRRVQRGRSKSALVSSSQSKRASRQIPMRQITDAAAVDMLRLVRQIESMTDPDVLKETKKKIRLHLKQKHQTELAAILTQCERACDLLHVDPLLDPRIDPRIYAPIEALIGELTLWMQRLSSADKSLHDLVQELTHYYVQSLATFKEVGYEAARVPDTTLTMVAQNAKRRLVSPEILAALDGGIQQLTGHSKVTFFDGIYWKQNPEFPGIEYAVDLAYKRIMATGSPPSLLVKRTQYEPKTLTPLSTLYQASQGVEGTIVSRMFQKDKDWISKLDVTNFCFMYTLALLTLPQDGKGDNIIVSQEFDQNRQLKYIFTSIDNDHSFADPVCVSSKGKHFVNLRSIFFCFPQAKERFDEDARNRLLHISPEIITVGWLEELNKQNVLYSELLDEGVFNEDEYKAMQFPIHLRPGTAINFYTTLQAIQQLLRSSDDITPDQLFEHLYPTCHAYYNAVMVAHRGTPMHVGDLFSAHIFSGDDFEAKPDLMNLSVAPDMVGPLADPEASAVQVTSSLKQVKKVPISELLSKVTAKSDDYESARSKLPAEELEDLLEKMDLSRLSSVTEHELLRKLCGFSYMNFTLIGSQSFSMVDLRAILDNSPSLLRLELHHCRNIKLSEVMETVNVHRLRECEVVISGDNVDPQAAADYPDNRLTIHRLAQVSVYATETIRKTAKHTDYSVEMFTGIGSIRSGNFNVAVRRFETAQMKRTDCLVIFANQIKAILTRDTLRQLISPGNTTAITFFLRHNLLDVNQPSSDGESPFHLATRIGSTPLFDLLLGSGRGNVNACTTTDQRTPLHIAVLAGHTNLIEKLLALGANINALDASGHSALSLAIISRYASASIQLDVVSVLVASQPDLRIKYEKEDNNTALHLSIKSGLLSIALLLLEAGAPLDLVNNFKETLLHLAVLRTEPFIEPLLKKGVPKNAKNSYGKTPLMLAAMNMNVPNIEALCKGGADPDVQDDSGYTALTHCIQTTLASANLDAVRALVLQGHANPNAYDSSGHSPTWYAAAVLYRAGRKESRSAVSSKALNPLSSTFPATAEPSASPNGTPTKARKKAIRKSEPRRKSAATPMETSAAQEQAESSNVDPNAASSSTAASSSHSRSRQGSLKVPALTMPPPPSQGDIIVHAISDDEGSPSPVSQGSTPSTTPASSLTDDSLLANSGSTSSINGNKPKLPPPSLRKAIDPTALEQLAADAPLMAAAPSSTPQELAQADIAAPSPISKRKSEKHSKNVKSPRKHAGHKTAPPQSKTPRLSPYQGTQLDIAKFLLSKKGDLSSQSPVNGGYYVHYLAQRIIRSPTLDGCGLREIQFLIDHDVALTTSNADGQNILHILCNINLAGTHIARENGLQAAVSYFVPIVRLILDSLGDDQRRRDLIFQEDSAGYTPLALSVGVGEHLLPTLSKYGGLLEYLNSMKEKDRDTDRNPYIMAIRQGSYHTLTALVSIFDKQAVQLCLKTLKKAALNLPEKRDEYLKFLSKIDAM